ncbi:MAG TPA: acyltransferase [Crocinitomicaceae bacterium]|nr:acyltransferase [Crocinitomicaceae bacterium]
MKKINRGILKLFGWKIDETYPEGVEKAVVIMGPHTSNWDFIIGRMSFTAMGIKGKYLIKKELFFFPLGLFLRAIGGISVDRSGRNNVTTSAVKHFNDSDRMYMVFTPEGTRSYNPKWKKGFYYIAKKANVPIAIGYIDYEKKIGGFHSVYNPTDDVEKDVQHIKDILKNYKGRFPEKGIDGK